MFLILLSAAQRQPSRTATCRHRHHHRRLLLLCLCAAFLLALLCGGTGAQGQATRLCPRCPLCSRSHTSLKDRLTYCHSISSYPLSFLTGGGAPGGQTSLAGWRQPHGAALSHRQQRHRYPFELPFTTDDQVRTQCMRDVTDLLLSRVRGQPQVVTPLLDVLRRKLAYPREPVVLHLAGDNGVGKTLTARLVSQAMSLRCAVDRDGCDAGDNLLTIAGTGFDGMSVAEARASIVAQVMAHAARYPHGVVLVDDLTAMDPVLVTALAPLFGRASHFPEQLRASEGEGAGSGGGALLRSLWPLSSSPSSSASSASVPPLSQLLVFITTDFGRQGRTVGKSRAEIETMVQEDFAALYGTLLPAYTRTYVFFPFATATAAEVVRSVVQDLPCALGEHLIAASHISDVAVHFLVEQHRALWQGKENGHALRRLVEDELISQLIVHWELHAVQGRLLVRFEMDEAELRVVLRLPQSNIGGGFEAGAAALYRSTEETGEAATPTDGDL